MTSKGYILQPISVLPSSWKQLICMSESRMRHCTWPTICLYLSLMPIIIKSVQRLQSHSGVPNTSHFTLNPEKRLKTTAWSQNNKGWLVVLYHCVGTLQLYWEKTAGDLMVSKQIIIVPTWKTATKTDLPERRAWQNEGAEASEELTMKEESWGHWMRERRPAWIKKWC